jgi:predicted nucleic acid-binding protein
MPRYKVIVDTNVLIAASLNHACQEIKGVQLKDHFYQISKPLFDYFRVNIHKYEGIITSEIENSARDQIVNAVIKKISKEANLPQKRLKKYLSNYSMTLILIIDSLNRNLNLLTRIPIDESAINRTAKRVATFYDDLLTKLPDPKRIIRKRTKQAPRGMQKFFKEFAKEDEAPNIIASKKIKRKLERDPPNRNDYRILGLAIHLNDTVFKEYSICLASTDHHFSRIKYLDGSLASYIPDWIERRFHIKCDWPDTILKILKGR